MSVLVVPKKEAAPVDNRSDPTADILLQYTAAVPVIAQEEPLPTKATLQLKPPKPEDTEDHSDMGAHAVIPVLDETKEESLEAKQAPALSEAQTESESPVHLPNNGGAPEDTCDHTTSGSSDMIAPSIDPVPRPCHLDDLQPGPGEDVEASRKSITPATSSPSERPLRSPPVSASSPELGCLEPTVTTTSTVTPSRTNNSFVQPDPPEPAQAADVLATELKPAKRKKKRNDSVMGKTRRASVRNTKSPSKMAPKPHNDDTRTGENQPVIDHMVESVVEPVVEPVNINGAQRGWRPMVAFLPYRLENVKIVSGLELKPLITDDFILVPNPRTYDAGTEYVVRFTGDRIE